MKNSIYFLLLIALLPSCFHKKSVENQTDEALVKNEMVREQRKSKNNRTIQGTGDEVSLKAYLRRVPGVRIQGDAVNVTGANTSLILSEQPLFVLNGVQIGNDLSEVERLVNVQDIDRIEVLKTPAETSMFGSRGSNGVIIITTKK